MRRTILVSAFIRRLVIVTLGVALATVILATTAFAQKTTTPAPTSQPTATPTATQTPEPTSTPTSESTSTPTPTPTPEPTQSQPTATPTPTPTSTPEPTALTTPESTTEQTTPELTTEEPGGIPSITVNPTQEPPGTTVTVTGRGWQDFAGEPVDIQTALVGDVSGVLDPLPTRVAGQPDNNGTFSVSLTIPESAPPGREVKIMAILGNGSSVDASFTVTPAKSETPGGTGGQDQPSNLNKETKPQDPTPNGPGNSHRNNGGNHQQGVLARQIIRIVA